MGGGDLALRQYYVRAIVDRIEVGDSQIRITGVKKALEHAIGRFDAKQGTPVPNIEREWRTRQESNLWPLPSEGIPRTPPIPHHNIRHYDKTMI